MTINFAHTATLPSLFFSQCSRIHDNPKEKLVRASVDIQKMNEEIIAASKAVTLQQSKPWQLEQLMSDRKCCILKRNKILNSFYKRYLPYYKNQLQTFESILDDLDSRIYQIHSENSLKKSDLDNILWRAEQRLKKYL